MKLRIRLRSFFFLLLGAGCLITLATLGIGGCSSPISLCETGTVHTSSGDICGEVLQNMNIFAFRGIPYAEAPVGTLRFMPPLAKSASPSLIHATAFGPLCPQFGSVPAFFEPAEGIDEDCLTLNIWQPVLANKNPLPVMLWIHGGEYLRHGSGLNAWDGRILASRENVVVVSINYRLGALGFLYDAEDGIEGNMGLKDQQLAMNWVQDNIQNFGGDPMKVTLFGWSAGAISVTAHALSIPSSRSPRELFRSILSQSNVLGNELKDTDNTTLSTQSDTFRETLCPGISAGSALSCLQSASISDILSAQNTAGSFFPVLDGSFLTQQAITGALQGLLDLPAIIGSVQNEGNLFVAQQVNSSTLSASSYESRVVDLLGASNALKVLAEQPYMPSSGNNIPQFQDVQTDYLFGCPAHYLATQARGPIFVYDFLQLPNVNVNWNQSEDPNCTGPVCLACSNAVCHGDEHPFMWNSLPIINTTAPIPDPLFTLLDTSQQDLANAMQDYWGNFAKNLDPGSVNGHTWPSFATQGEYQIFGCQGEACTTILSTTIIVPYNSCEFWDTQIGYEGLPPSSE